jgi:hypothetical protein
VLTAAAVLDAPDDPSGRGLLLVVAAVLVLALAAVHVRLLLRVAPRSLAEWPQPVVESVTRRSPAPSAPAPSVPALREPVDATRS